MLAAVIAAGLPQLASAEDMSYSFIEGGTSWLDPDGFSGTELGFNVRFSADLVNGFYLQGAWDSWDVDSFDVDLYRIGAGYRYSLQQSTDLFFEASYAAFEVGPFDDDGFRTDIGLRHGFGKRAEGRIYGGYQGDGSSGDIVLGADLLFKFNDTLGLSAGVETFEFDTNVFRTNLRLSF
ncbi:MAG: hypothetical protein CVV18_05205 [Gammaproteobacteria bacterium HGW-Gammaproteobacteria-8]|nr:MAG: hypothetical protein CVV18_05205 [Gammaproteobacteria bacterium HGW-Gammaproteobacteria-8]